MVTVQAVTLTSQGLPGLQEVVVAMPTKEIPLNGLVVGRGFGAFQLNVLIRTEPVQEPAGAYGRRYGGAAESYERRGLRTGVHAYSAVAGSVPDASAPSRRIRLI